MKKAICILLSIICFLLVSCTETDNKTETTYESRNNEELLKEIELLKSLITEVQSSLSTQTEDNEQKKLEEENVEAPEGWYFCGRCTGCGTEHFEMDMQHNHTDCGCDYDCHCHLPPEECDCNN